MSMWGEGEEDRVSVREREERDGGRSGCGTCLQNHNGAPHGKVRHYYVQKWVKAWANIVVAHFLLGAPLVVLQKKE